MPSSPSAGRAAVSLVAAVACADALDPIIPAGPSTAAVVMGAVRTPDGAAVAGAAGQISVYVEAGGRLRFVTGRPTVTDDAGEFADTLTAANTTAFEATVHVVIYPPGGAGLAVDSATGSVWFQPSVADTLLVEIVLEPA